MGLADELQRATTDKEISERLGVDPAKLRKIRNAFATATLWSLDAPLRRSSHKMREGEELRLTDSVHSTLPSPLQIALFNGLRSELSSSMHAALTPPERDVIRMRLGVDGATPMTRAEVGKRFNPSKRETQRIEKLALRKLRNRVDPGWLEMEHELEA